MPSSRDQNPSVACVIPTHARDGSLERALASIAGQTLRPSVVVVVDDVGSAATKAMVEGFADRIPVVHIDASGLPMKGAAASRNRGVESAGHAAFVAFLDDDDRWQPDFLQRCVDRAVERDVDLVASWGTQESTDHVYLHAWHAAEGLTPLNVFSRSPGITGSNFVIRTAAFDAAGRFDPEQWVFNDLEFVVRFLDAGRSYAVVEEDLVVQAIEPGEHLSSRSDRRAEGILRYLRLYRPRMTRAQIRVLQRQAAVARLHRKQTRVGRVRYLIVALAHSSPRFLGHAIAARLRRDARY